MEELGCTLVPNSPLRRWACSSGWIPYGSSGGCFTSFLIVERARKGCKTMSLVPEGNFWPYCSSPPIRMRFSIRPVRQKGCDGRAISSPNPNVDPVLLTAHPGEARLQVDLQETPSFCFSGSVERKEGIHNP